MKIPKLPPDFNTMLNRVIEEDRLPAVFAQGTRPRDDGKYFHWDKLRHLSPPSGLSHEDWWLLLKLGRQAYAKPVPLRSCDGALFSYNVQDPIPERLHTIDQNAAGRIDAPKEIRDDATKDRYIFSSLIEEAITSSQLEGAATTRAEAQAMIRERRRPRDNSERMILNNYHTMSQIALWREKPLTPEMVKQMHHRVTAGTLNSPNAAGRFRREEEDIKVGDPFIESIVFHKPPPARELNERVAVMCNFANGEALGEFVHPVIRAIILHFWLAYDHPFVDGNGRAARALFYWSMLRQGYWLCEFISISEIILKAPAKYGRAFLYTETDDNDLTYFILYHLEVIRRAIEKLFDHVARKVERIRTSERELRLLSILNHRQSAVMRHALRHPHFIYSIQAHMQSHQVVYQTARVDLLNLSDRGLLRQYKLGREWRFTPVENLEQRLQELLDAVSGGVASSKKS